MLLLVCSVVFLQLGDLLDLSQNVVCVGLELLDLLGLFLQL